MNIMSLLNDPRMAAAAGLLDPNGTYGNFGSALSQGLLASQQAQNMNLGRKMREAELKEAEEQAKRRKMLQQQFQQWRGTPGTEQMGPRRPQFQGQPLMAGGTGALADGTIGADDYQDLVGRLMANPETMQAGIGMLNALKPSAQGPTVNVNTAPGNRAEEAAMKAYGPMMASVVEGKFNEADAARTENMMLDRMTLAMAEGADPGVAKGFLNDAKSALATFGVPVEITKEMGEEQVMRMLQSTMMTMFRSPDSATGGLPGATSNKDLVLLSNASPGLSHTKEGNKQMIKYRKKINNLRIAVADEVSNIMGREGKIPLDINTRISDFVSKYDIFTPAERKEMEAFMESSAGTAETADDIARRILGE